MGGMPMGGMPMGGMPMGGMLPGMAGGMLPQLVPPAAPVAPPAPQTACLKLEGMLSEEMLDNDDEYGEIVEDIKSECENSGGPVEAIVMPRTGPLKLLCFVRFASEADAAKARASLDQRQFDGNVVKAFFITPEEMPPQ